MAKLSIFRDEMFERDAVLSPGTTKIGRGEQNDIVLADHDKLVSRFHAEVRFDGSAYTIVDLQSANGIVVGGQKVPEAGLSPGLAVGIGHYRLIFSAEEPAAGDGGATVPSMPAFAPAAVPVIAADVRPLPAAQIVPIDRSAVPPPFEPGAPLHDDSPTTREGGPAFLAVTAAPAAAPAPPPGVQPAVPAENAPPPEAAPPPAAPSAAEAAAPPPPPADATPTPAAGTPVAAPARTPPAAKAAARGRGRRLVAAAATVALLAAGSLGGYYYLFLMRGADGTARVPPPAATAPAATRPATPGEPPVLPAVTGTPLSVAPATVTAPPDTPTAPPMGAAAGQAARPAKPARSAGRREPATMPRSPAVPAPAKPAPPSPQARTERKRPPEPAPAPTKSRSLSSMLEGARAALIKGDYLAAVTDLEAILAVDPKYPEAADLLGIARGGARNAAQMAVNTADRHEMSGEYDLAQEQYERAVKLDPANLQAADGAKRVRARRVSEGEEQLKKARQFEEQGRRDEAVAAYERALKLLPPGHADVAAARQRLAALKGGNPGLHSAP